MKHQGPFPDTPDAEPDSSVIDWVIFQEARTMLGADFIRILGYFQEDGTKSVSAIEAAMRAKNAAELILPAHTLKGESKQFGAEPLSELAEIIETGARRCVEYQHAPDELIHHVVKLRPLFELTMQLFERETNPLVERRGGFRRGGATNQSFGRG